MSEISDDVFCFSGTDVNFIVLREGRDLTLIDGGWPGDVATVEDSIRSIGHKPEDVCAILLTHAHIDHLGAVDSFHRRFAIPVYSDPIEVHHAAREYLEQANADDVKKGPMPRSMLWWNKMLKVGADDQVKIDDVLPVGAGALDIPGHPIAVATHGHTSGHSAYHLPDSGVVITGDGLVTGHPLAVLDGPQICPWFFNHSVSEALSALDVLTGLDAGIIAPGHGNPLRMPIAEAVDIAHRNAHKQGLDQRQNG